MEKPKEKLFVEFYQKRSKLEKVKGTVLDSVKKGGKKGIPKLNLNSVVSKN